MLMSTPRNAFEKKILKLLPIEFKYEPMRMPYTLPHYYLPDFVDVDRKIICEGKGRWTGADRNKVRAIIAAYPDWKIVMCFYDENQKLSKKSKTTYAAYCKKYSIPYCTLATLTSTIAALLAQ